jgi:lipid A 3-O-deacylase
VAVGAAALWGAHTTSQAIDSGSFEFANGNRTQIARVGVQWNWQRLWWKSDAMQLDGYWDLSAGGWRQNRFHSVVGEMHDIADIGLTLFSDCRQIASGYSGAT